MHVRSGDGRLDGTMSSTRLLVSLVDSFREAPADAPWLELRRAPHEPWSRIGESLSAVGNGAALARQPYGYVLVGADPESREVVGVPEEDRATRAPDAGLLTWLQSTLSATFVARHEVEHPDGRVVLFEVACASGRPLRFLGRGYVLASGRVAPLERFEELEAALWAPVADWSAELVDGASLADLDPVAIEMARAAYLAPLPALERESRGWDDAEFLARVHLTRGGDVTRAALLLLGRAASAGMLAPAVPQITWTVGEADGVVVEHAHHEPPFLTAVDEVLGRIRNRTLPSSPGLEADTRQYEPATLREVVLNAVAHQDYALRGWLHVSEMADRVVVTNPARLTATSLERALEQGVAGLAVQNPFLARAMARLGLIDLAGGGLRRSLRRQWAHGLPLPDVESVGHERVRVTLHGRVVDPAFAPLARSHPSLDLALVRALDLVQKGERVSLEQRRALRERGLVEGKEPLTVLSGSFARAAGLPSAATGASATGNQVLREVVLSLVRARGSVSRTDVDAALVPRLPRSLSDRQRRTKVDNVVKSLARSGAIANLGSRRYPRWTLVRGRPGA
jgi:ATP-dependent DNA helicase RecG